MNNLVRIISVGLLFSLMISSTVFAYGRDERSGMQDYGSRIEHFQKDLHMTPEQLQKMSAINLEFKKVQLKHFQVIQPIELKIKEQLLQDNVDYDQLRALMTQMAPEKIEVHLDMIRHQRAIEALLTPEQRILLKHNRQCQFDKAKRVPR